LSTIDELVMEVFTCIYAILANQRIGYNAFRDHVNTVGVTDTCSIS
jgi:hypothetical protein